MSLKILIADPDQDFLADASSYFNRINYEVDPVRNGKDAQIALAKNEYFAFIINLDLQDYSAVQVLRFLKQKFEYQVTVVIADTKKSMEEKNITEEKLQNLGVTNVLIKPFEYEQLAQILEGHQGIGDIVTMLPKDVQEQAEEQPDDVANYSDEHFTMVKVDDFYSSSKVLFDLYIRLKSNRYLKFLHAGDDFDGERVDRYKHEKGVEYFYYRKTDQKKYVKFMKHVAQKTIQSKSAPIMKKVNLLKTVSEQFLKDVYSEGIKPQIVHEGKEIATEIYKVVHQENDLYKILRDFNDFDPSAFTHSYLVTLFSSALIKQFKWQSKVTLETAALACLFHDIGKIKLPERAAKLRPTQMTDEELAQYKKHPELGLEMVMGNQSINNAVRQIILQHHEYMDGTGFPHGRKGQNVFVLGNLVHMVDDFVDIISQNKIKPPEALRILLTNESKVARYEKSLITNFIRVFVDPDKLARNDEGINKFYVGDLAS